MATTEHQFGFEISDKIAQEVNKLDVWTVMSPMAGFVPKDSINLGQGFMNWAPPTFLRDAAKVALDSVAQNHYALPRGVPRLRKALAKHFSPSYGLPGGRELDPESEIIVTSGANEGMYAFAAAFLQPGDEVILFEPYFDQYTSQVKYNGGVPVYVPIRAPAGAASSVVPSSEWKVDIDELKAAITPKTKMIWVNSPHNPIGKVFDIDELRAIGNVAEENNLIILSDEVYDCMTFDGKPHIRMASIDNFWKRTVTVGSAGKSFSCTGWRIGWLIGPANLIRPALAISTRIVFCSNHPAQEATAVGIEACGVNKFFENQLDEYEERRKVMMEGLDKLGLPYTVPEGGYFIMLNTKQLEVPESFVIPEMLKGRARDWVVAWFIAQTVGVVSIPPTDFYSTPNWNLGEDYLRLAFCKDLQTIRDASERLLKLKPYIKAA